MIMLIMISAILITWSATDGGAGRQSVLGYGYGDIILDIEEYE